MEISKNNPAENNSLNPELLKISKSICKIKILNKENLLPTFSGFLFKFHVDQEFFYCLVICKDIISANILKRNDIICISYDNELKKLNINFDNKKRYIKSFTDIGFNITVAEILYEDEISTEYFLTITFEKKLKKKLTNAYLYIPQYSNEKKLIFIKGKIKENNNKEFSYLSNEVTQAGFPIILDNDFIIFGINKEPNNNDEKENYGKLIYPVINIIKADIRKKRNTGKYEKGKYIWEDGKYYEGKFKNNLPNGKGIKYYTNGNILYKGDFINGKFEGKGKYFYENKEYYIGQYKDGLANGKGKIYFENGKIQFVGEFIDGYAEGKGKEYSSDGKILYDGYYVGGLIEGKGTEYYLNGKINYEGNYVASLREGFGKYIWENGGYYIGQWRNGFKHGKGIEYYSNGKIVYEGTFVYDKMEGTGKFNFKNGDIYVGQFKNGYATGVGVGHYSNGNRYTGDYVKNNINGYGKYIWEDGEYYIGQWKNNLRHGKGTLYDSDGKIINKGKWLNDEFIG